MAGIIPTRRVPIAKVARKNEHKPNNVFSAFHGRAGLSDKMPTMEAAGSPKVMAPTARSETSTGKIHHTSITPEKKVIIPSPGTVSLLLSKRSRIHVTIGKFTDDWRKLNRAPKNRSKVSGVLKNCILAMKMRNTHPRRI